MAALVSGKDNLLKLEFEFEFLKIHYYCYISALRNDLHTHQSVVWQYEHSDMGFFQDYLILPDPVPAFRGTEPENSPDSVHVSNSFKVIIYLFCEVLMFKLKFF